MAGYLLARLLVEDLQTFLFRFLNPYCSALPLVGPAGERIEVAVITDGIILAYIILLHLLPWFGRYPMVRLQTVPLDLELLRRDKMCQAMLVSVSGTFKPFQRLLVQLIYRVERAPTKEVVLHVFHHVLYLSLRFRI